MCGNCTKFIRFNLTDLDGFVLELVGWSWFSGYFDNFMHSLTWTIGGWICREWVLDLYFRKKKMIVIYLDKIGLNYIYIYQLNLKLLNF